jgi:hypothetical protein
MTQTQPTNTRPIHKIRVGSVEAAIWRYEQDQYRRHRVSFQRRYKNKDGQFRSTTDFNTDEAVLLIQVAKLATDWMMNHDAMPVSVNV